VVSEEDFGLPEKLISIFSNGSYLGCRYKLERKAPKDHSTQEPLQPCWFCGFSGEDFNMIVLF